MVEASWSEDASQQQARKACRGEEDCDPKHAANAAQTRFKDDKVSVLRWPSQSSDLWQPWSPIRLTERPDVPHRLRAVIAAKVGLSGRFTNWDTAETSWILNIFKEDMWSHIYFTWNVCNELTVCSKKKKKINFHFESFLFHVIKSEIIYIAKGENIHGG